MGAGAVAVAPGKCPTQSCTRLPEAGGTVTDYDLRGGVPKVVRRYPSTISELPTALDGRRQRHRRCDHSVIFRGMPGLCRALEETAPRGAYPLKTVFRMRRIRLRVQDARHVPITSPGAPTPWPSVQRSAIGYELLVAGTEEPRVRAVQH